MTKKILLALTALGTVSILFGCQTTYYLPLIVDEKSGQYPASRQVEPGGILVFKTGQDPRDFPIIILSTKSNYHPTKFAFQTRSALSQSGFANVYTWEEFRKLSADRGMAIDYEVLNTEAIRKFSATYSPVLIVNASFNLLGNSRCNSTINVTEGRTTTSLLEVDYSAYVWNSWDSEGIYPVFNELRKWFSESKKGRI